MSQDLIHHVDDEDRDLARSAADRTNIKAALAHEVIVQQLITHGVDPDTPIPEKLAIAKELKDITAVTERAKRQVAAEGAGQNTAPIIQFNFPSGMKEVFTVEPLELGVEDDLEEADGV